MTNRGSLRTKMSSKGQLVVPRELRERRGWREGTVLELEETPRGVLLRVAEPGRTLDVADLVGSAGYSGPRRTLAEMERAIDDEGRRRGSR
ncbi:MAG: AbrB/MazE/SpoVT family DNA-binding domain-containing protein [Myxococcota bacterium]|nr:AbrB/MazE/SpoVT family DNA-binding domain-containing protein [Myxococcota bacterium]